MSIQTSKLPPEDKLNSEQRPKDDRITLDVSDVRVWRRYFPTTCTAFTKPGLYARYVEDSPFTSDFCQTSEHLDSLTLLEHNILRPAVGQCPVDPLSRTGIRHQTRPAGGDGADRAAGRL